jgi:iron complex outermembrane receptor protein
MFIVPHYAMRPLQSILLVIAFAMISPRGARAQAAAASGSSQPQAPTVQEHVEVIATRVPEEPSEVPTAIEVFTGDELRARGAVDLTSALSLAAGVDVAPGGDGGPASSVPEFYGLKEFDAFLLVVDGVPWGGAFNPALATLNLSDVERIEVLRGPAPVMYGATSFVGVIHVVHKGAARTERDFAVSGGSFQSGNAMFSTSVPLGGSWNSRLVVDAGRSGYRDDRTSFRRGHVLWRNTTPWGAGRFWFNVDGTWLNQDPASPHPREGPELSSSVPLDANHNPSGAFLNDRRFAFSTGFDRPLGKAQWSTIGSVSPARQDIMRGFLVDLTDTPDNARGLREKIDFTDIYVDSHFGWKLPHDVHLIAGGDFLHGEGKAEGADFDYQAPLSGASEPVAVVPETLDLVIEDRREFAGVYGFSEWHVTPRLRIDAGLRLNLTFEEREGGDEAERERERAAGEENARDEARLSGSAGVIWTGWQQGSDFMRLFASYRNTFKPAAFDFGLGEAEEGGGEEGLLDPETSQSYEGGIKTRHLQGRLGVEVSGFWMNFQNLVIAQAINGLPALTNAGTQRFKGIETAVSGFLPSNVIARATYSFHDARFRNYLTEFDGVPTQLAGKRLEMSPRHLAAVGVLLNPQTGIIGNVEVRYVGDRYLNKRNTALADAYTTLGAAIGYRVRRWEVRLDARNLTDERPPVSESELGDAQYYRLPARRFDVTFSTHF